MTARPMTKAGVMIGSTVSARRVRRKRKPVRVATSAKARPSSVERTPTRTARKKRVPGDAAARPAGQAGERPEAVAEEALAEGGERVAVVGDEGVQQHLRDRHEDEERDGGDDEADRADDEDVAADGAARGDAEGEEEEEGERSGERAVAHAELAAVELAEERLEPVVAPAAQADGEALHQQPAEAGGADDDAAGGRRSGPALSRPQASSGSSRTRPSGASQGFSPWATRKSAGAASSSSGQPSRSQPKLKKPSSTAYQGRTAKPTSPTTIQRTTVGCSGRRAGAVVTATAAARPPRRPTS